MTAAARIPPDPAGDMTRLAHALAEFRRRYRHVIDADVSDALDEAATLLVLDSDIEGLRRHG